ncbi:MAG: helix-turn-helix domain-containing protein, partial [Duodenibacillus sp.]
MLLEHGDAIHEIVVSVAEVGSMGDIDGIELVYSLSGYPDETEWIEFKEGNTDLDRIARDISALANAAAFHERPFAYKLWGVADGTHELVGTSFDPYAQRVRGNQNLHIWLKQVLSVNAVYEFKTAQVGDRSFVILKIHAASDQPVCYNGDAYIREGSSTTLLATESAKSAELWRRLQRRDFERRKV